MSHAPDHDLVILITGEVRVDARPTSAQIDQMRSLVSAGDVLIGSLETVLTERTDGVNKFSLSRASAGLAEDLNAIGFDVIALATNHALDYYVEGMRDTVSSLSENGIATAGVGENLSAATKPAVIERDGRSIAVLSMASTIPPGWAADREKPGLAPVHVRSAFIVDDYVLAENPGAPPEVSTWPEEEDRNRAVADIRLAKELHDVVIVIMHWGLPDPWRVHAYPQIQGYQRVLGHAFIEAGADAIVGNHPYELNGIELYQGRPIVYCPGRFWTDKQIDWPGLSSEGVIVRLRFPAGGLPCQTRVYPILIGDDGVPRRDPSGKAFSVLNTLGTEHGVRIDDQGVVLPVRKRPSHFES